MWKSGRGKTLSVPSALISFTNFKLPSFAYQLIIITTITTTTTNSITTTTTTLKHPKSHNLGGLYFWNVRSNQIMKHILSTMNMFTWNILYIYTPPPNKKTTREKKKTNTQELESRFLKVWYKNKKKEKNHSFPLRLFLWLFFELL